MNIHDTHLNFCKTVSIVGLFQLCLALIIIAADEYIRGTHLYFGKTVGIVGAIQGC